MYIRTLSSERGITLLENGEQVIIHSSYYGVVAEGTRSTTHNEDYSFIKATYNFNICEWYGYWDLRSIIKRGITKFEKKDWNANEVEINFTTVEGSQMHLNAHLEISVIYR